MIIDIDFDSAAFYPHHCYPRLYHQSNRFDLNNEFARNSPLLMAFQYNFVLIVDYSLMAIHYYYFLFLYRLLCQSMIQAAAVSWLFETSKSSSKLHL